MSSKYPIYVLAEETSRSEHYYLYVRTGQKSGKVLAVIYDDVKGGMKYEFVERDDFTLTFMDEQKLKGWIPSTELAGVEEICKSVPLPDDKNSRTWTGQCVEELRKAEVLPKQESSSTA